MAYELASHLSRLAEVKMIIWGGSNIWLPLVLPYILLAACYQMVRYRPSVVYLQDGLLAPLGCLLKVFGKPAIVTVHGLDITYENSLFQLMVPRCIRRLDRVVCISEATTNACLKRGVPEYKIRLIADGISDVLHVDHSEDDLKRYKEELSRNTGLWLDGKKIILSTGRLTQRKGFHWFIQEVIPRIVARYPDCLYLIAGDGDYRSQVRKVAEDPGVRDHVMLLGQVGDEDMRYLYNIADVYVMPNIPVENDLEGFGLVVLEAASCEVPVVASRIGGIPDAIKDGSNGFLVEPENADAFAQSVVGLLEDEGRSREFGRAARLFTLENFTAQSMSEKYLRLFEESGRPN